MKIEWATICEEVVDRKPDPRIDLVSANVAGSIVAALPTDLAVTVAMCLLAEPGEIESGGVLQIDCVMFRPGQPPTPAGSARLLWAYSEGVRMNPELPARKIVPLEFGFHADIEGPYTLGILVEGEGALVLPYVVRVEPEST